MSGAAVKERKPAFGRDVRYVLPGGTLRPMKVVQENADGTVNGIVFLDVSDGFSNPVRSAQNVPYDPQQSHGSWHWPVLT